MYKKQRPNSTSINLNQSQEGETIEAKIRRIVNNGEPITDGAPLIYQEREDGVQPEYDPRTDRWEVAVDGMDRVQKEKIAKREERAKAKEEAKVIKLDEKKAGESQQGTAEQ